MYRKMGIKLTTKYSPNFGLPKRPKKRIKFIIIHYTGMKKETAAIERLLNPRSKVSYHIHGNDQDWSFQCQLNVYSMMLNFSN